MTADSQAEVDMSADGFDPLVWASLDDPFVELNEMRHSSPVAHSSVHGGFWNVLSYADVTNVSRNNKTFSNSQITIPPPSASVPAPPLSMDPPVHGDYRKPLMPYFSPKAIEGLEPFVRETVTGLIDDIIEKGSGDLAQDLAIPLPAIVGMEFLSLPREDMPRLKEWADQIFTNTGNPDKDMADYFGQWYDRLAGSTADDIPSVVRRLVIQGEPIDRIHYIRTMTQLVGGALDTTANGASQTLLLLCRRPELRDRLIADHSLLPTAIEEFLRYVSPLPGLSRVVMADTEVGGQSISAGEKLLLNYLSANHDPAEFESPEDVVIERTPNRHVAFGLGAHRCIGAHVARLELKVLFTEVLDRLPDYRVLEDKVTRAQGFTRMITSLPVEFSPGPRLGRDKS